jgi:hypothetical protein
MLCKNESLHSILMYSTYAWLQLYLDKVGRAEEPPASRDLIELPALTSGLV